MRNNELTSRGGAKKFLYTGPKSRDVDETEDLPWNFSSKNSSPRGESEFSLMQKYRTSFDSSTNNMNSNPMATKFGMEDVWSIKRDVNVGNRQQKSDGLTFNTSKSYYSRYGGVKEKDGGPTESVSNSNNTQQGNQGASWNMTSARRPFSYSFNNDPKSKQQTEGTVSPRNVSNSSFGHYTGTGNSFGGTGNSFGGTGNSFGGTGNSFGGTGNSFGGTGNGVSGNNNNNPTFDSKYKSPW